MSHADFVVIGGGIGGVCCAQELARLNHGKRVLLVTASDVLSESKAVIAHTERLQEISVFECTAERFKLANPAVEILQARVLGVDAANKTIFLSNNSRISFGKLCLAVGVRPQTILDGHPLVLGLRDAQSVEDMVAKLVGARRVVVVGNGGIALELVHELTFCKVDWILRDDYLGSKFFDATASAFILPSLHARARDIMSAPKELRSPSAHHTRNFPEEKELGYGLGPDWASKTSFRTVFGANVSTDERDLDIHFQQVVVAVSDDRGQTWIWTEDGKMTSEADKERMMQINTSCWDLAWPLIALTSTGKVIGCDLLISATGVKPNLDFLHKEETEISLDEDGYIVVDDNFESSCKDVFAIGDCCVYCPQIRDTQHFFQMRLWSQARVMGVMAAQCMSGVQDDYGTETQLELFAHVTRFFGFKVVLLGRYNAQGMDDKLQLATKRLVVTAENSERLSTTEQNNHSGGNTDRDSELEIWIRITPNKEYVKLVVLRGKIIGALLIGDTDLEETMENLILNQLDVSRHGIALLDPDLDIADYFD